MSREAARLELVGLIAAAVTAHTSYPLLVEYDNVSVIDQATQVNPYLQVQIKGISGIQLSLGNTGILVEQQGQLLLAAVVKEGTGSKAANDLIDFVTSYVELKKLALVQTFVLEPQKEVSLLGMYYVPALVNFIWHRVTP